MGELRGGYKVHFVLAWVLCGAALLCMASTWLPVEYAVPKWIMVGLFVGIFPVFAVALFSGAARLARGGPQPLIRYVLLLPLVLRLAYLAVIGACLLGFATGTGAAQDVRADASGYYYTYWDRDLQPQQSSRVALTEPEYYDALKSELRIFSATPALFYAFSSFLVLASAAAARTQTVPGRSPGSAKKPGRS